MSSLKEQIRRLTIETKIRRTKFFDKEWYVRQNHLIQGTDPYRHYLDGGWRQSDPSPFFSNQRYLEANIDVQGGDVCPLEHYLLYGKQEKRKLFIGQVPGKKWILTADQAEYVTDRHKVFPETGRETEKLTNPDQKEEKILVSVIIPTYNRAQTILESCRSVLNQTYRNLELIVVDDCSEDQTEEVIQRIQDPRIRYIRHEKNMGACVARNTGIKAARGKYVAFQDSDDLWRPEKLETQVKASRQTGSEVCFCRYLRIDPKGGENTGPSYYYRRGIQTEIQTVFGIGTQTLLIRKDVLEEDQFDPEMPRFQDLELLMRLAKKWRFCFCDETLVVYRTGTDSISANPERLILACDMLMKKHPDIREEFPLMCRELAYLLLSTAENGKDQKLCGEMARMAVRYDNSRDVRRQAAAVSR